MSMIKNERLWSVYRHVSPSGKIYIGATKDPKHRWRGNGNGYKGSTGIWDAIQEYGWDNFDHEIIASGLTEQEAHAMESELIERYDTMNPDRGYNLTSGGRHGKFSLEAIDRLSASQMGHPVSDKVRAILAERHNKPVVCIETGEVFKNSEVASFEMGLCRTSILKAAHGKQDTCGGYHFATLRDYENGTIPRFVPAPSPYNRVRCITTGEEFENVCDASRKTGLSRRAISYACNGVHDTCGGKRWEFIQRHEEGDD